MIYSKENCYYPWGYKHPYILNDQTIIFSSLLNPYINDSEKYIFVNLNNFSERLVENIAYYDEDYDSANKLFIIHQLDKNIYLQLERVERSNEKRWSIVKEEDNKFSFIKKFKDNNILGDNLYFLSDNLIITWNFIGTSIKFILYE